MRHCGRSSTLIPLLPAAQAGARLGGSVSSQLPQKPGTDELMLYLIALGILAGACLATGRDITALASLLLMGALVILVHAYR